MRIYLSMGAMVALMLVVGGFGAYQTSRLASTFVDYRSTAKESLIAGDIMEDIFEARLASSKYRLTGDPAHLESVRENIAEVLEFEGQLREMMTGYEGLEELEQIPAALEEYEQSMAQAVELQAQRNQLVDKASASGLKARRQLSDVMETALQDNDASISSAAGLAATNLLLGRLYFERFLVSNDPDDAARSTKEIDTARVGLNTLLGELENPRRRELTQMTMTDLDDFDTTSSEVADVIFARNALYGRVDNIGPEVLTAIEHTVDYVVDQQNTLGPAGQVAAQRSIIIVAVFAILGSVLGGVLAFVTGRIISRNLTTITENMKELADGNLEVDIHPTQDDHEVGKMTNAMVVFLDNARHARDLDIEVKEKEKLEREREAADRDRDVALEKERRTAEEEERRNERERMEILQNFQTDMERVLGEAASGNFSNRMSDSMDDESLAGLADVINRLLEATETNISDVVSSIGELSKGNLGIRIDGHREGVFERMQSDFNQALTTLSHTMAQIMNNGQSVSSTAAELESSSGSMAKRAEDSAAAVEETSAAVEQITASIRQVVQNAKAADDATHRVRERAAKTREVSNETEASINAMIDASAQIDRVVKVIEDIAFQTNLLALNAGVEAARAGEAGRGFSVVASEVRALALRSQEAVQEISQVIERNTKSVEAGVEQVGLSRQALEGIISEVEVASGQISDIATAVEQQSGGIDEVNTAIQSIDSASQTNAAALEEMTASSVSLSGEATALANALRQFHGVSLAAKPDAPEQKITPPDASLPEHIEPQKAVVGATSTQTGWEEF
ncbi:methyl-accepting chemotaxis protein [Roseobacter sp.]